MEAVLIVGYGNRGEKAERDFRAVVQLVHKRSNFFVKGTTLKNISIAMENLLTEIPSLKVIKVVPLFLFEGIHIKRDLPTLLNRERLKYPSLEIRMGKPIGDHPLLADILVRRSQEIS